MCACVINRDERVCCYTVLAGNIVVEDVGVVWYILLRLGRPDGCPVPDSVAYIFVFLGNITLSIYKLNLSDQAKDTLQLIASLFGLVSFFFSQSDLTWRPDIFTGCRTLPRRP